MTQHASVAAGDWEEADQVILLFRSNKGDELRAYGPVTKEIFDSKLVSWWREALELNLELGDVIPVPLFKAPPVW